MPVHKLMKATHCFDGFFTRAKMQVVCVTQDNLSSAFYELFRRHGLHCGFSTHRHEHRSLNRTMRRHQSRTTCVACRFVNFKVALLHFNFAHNLFNPNRKIAVRKEPELSLNSPSIASFYCLEGRKATDQSKQC
ncbi:hypothetical protein D3C87_1389160 [compost metagenome]